MAISKRLTGGSYKDYFCAYTSYPSNDLSGLFTVTLYYDSVARKNSGNSNEVVFTNCYISIQPKDLYYWTTNTAYLDSVTIGNKTLVSNKNWYPRVDRPNKPGKYNSQGYTSGKTDITVDVGTRNATSITVTFKGHNSANTATQTLTGKISIGAGWSNIKKPSVSIGYNGANTVTFNCSNILGNTNNSLSSADLYYTNDGSDPTTASSNREKIQLLGQVANGSCTISKSLKAVTDSKYVKAIIYCTGSKGDQQNTGIVTKEAPYYRNPGKPTVPDIRPNTTTNEVTITSTKGTNGSNNPATGVEIYYTTDGTKPADNSTKYTAAFKVNSNTRIRAAARTVGTYTGPSNKKSFYYSEFNYADSNVDATSNPYEPTDLEIINSTNNEYYFRLKVGQSGTNNSSKGVEIYYTLDGSDPSTSQTRQSISINASEGIMVQSDELEIFKDQVVKATARTVGEKSTYKYSTFTGTVTKEILYYKGSEIAQPVLTFDKKLTKKSQIKIDAQATFYKHTQINLLNVVLYRSRGQENTVLTECAADINLSELNQQLQDQKVTVSIEKILNLKNFDVEKNDLIYVVIDCEEAVGFTQENLEVESKSYTVESSGVMRIKQSGKWYEGQVLVKVNGKWKEATDILIKDSSGWHESI